MFLTDSATDSRSTWNRTSNLIETLFHVERNPLPTVSALDWGRGVDRAWAESANSHFVADSSLNEIRILRRSAV